MVESITTMEVVIKDFGKMESLMVKVIMLVKQCNIKVDGKKISFMDTAKLYGKTGECMKEIILMEKNKVKEPIHTLMEKST